MTAAFSSRRPALELRGLEALALEAPANGPRAGEPAPTGPDPSRRTSARCLRRALAEGRVVPYFQPVVDLARGGVVAVEALARLVEPGAGVLTPGAFLTVAEEAGLLCDLDRVMLEGACAAVASWRKERPEAAELHLAVNISGRHLARGDLSVMVRSALAGTGLPPGALVLEITETELAATDDEAVRTLARLRDAGVGLALDDFGTAYSSLVYVQRYPLSQLKIDRRFVAGLGTGGAEEAIIDSVCHLARRLDATVVAEGVERPRQAAVLADLGCRLGQGHLFGRPAPVAATKRILGAWHRTPQLVAGGLDGEVPQGLSAPRAARRSAPWGPRPAGEGAKGRARGGARRR